MGYNKNNNTQIQYRTFNMGVLFTERLDWLIQEKDKAVINNEYYKMFLILKNIYRDIYFKFIEAIENPKQSPFSKNDIVFAHLDPNKEKTKELSDAETLKFLKYKKKKKKTPKKDDLIKLMNKIEEMFEWLHNSFKSKQQDRILAEKAKTDTKIRNRLEELDKVIVISMYYFGLIFHRDQKIPPWEAIKDAFSYTNRW